MFRKGLGVSLPKPRIVHGITVKKAPIGHYLAALETLDDLPRQIIEACFPGQSVSDAFTELTTADSDLVLTALSRLLTVAPKPVIAALCSIVGADADTVINTLSPKEFLDVWEAFWEVNELADFFMKARRVISKAGASLHMPSSGS